jgi:hypothetical protein
MPDRSIDSLPETDYCIPYKIVANTSKLADYPLEFGVQCSLNPTFR